LITAQIIPHEKLTAYQRWELGALNENVPLNRNLHQRETASPETQSDHAIAYETGFAAGHKKGRASVEQNCTQLTDLLSSVNNALIAMEQQLPEQILDLAVALARQVLRGELMAQRDVIIPVVAEAMEALPTSSTHRKLLLNPSDVDIVRAHLGEDIKLGGWQIMEDHLIEPGGCRIVAANGDIDATLASRWKNAVQALDRVDPWHDDQS
jgi:flagellar assembly protein FliH